MNNSLKEIYTNVNILTNGTKTQSTKSSFHSELRIIS